jgi:hypothetical protein
MTGLPRQAVWTAALIILFLAAYGAYEGWKRSASEPADNPSAVGAAITPANAVGKAATPIVEPPQPAPEALTEARVRSIARQEVQAALNPPAPSPPVITTPPPPNLRPVPPASDTGPGPDAAALSGARQP